MRLPVGLLATAGIAVLLISIPSRLASLVPKEEGESLDALAKVDERLRPSAPVEPLEDSWSLLAPKTISGWQKFLGVAGVSGQWSAYVDRRTGHVESVEGSGIPWIPGRGNQLSRADLAVHLTARKEIDLATMESIARSFLPEVAPALGVDPASLVLNHGRSGRFGESLWYVDFDVYREGLAIDGARVVFRVNSGNLVQFGTENLPSSGAAAPAARLDRETARARLAEYIGGLRSSDHILDKGSLHLLPAALDGERRGLVRVWQFVFRREGEGATWQARVDAATGEVLELYDINDYIQAQVSGGVYPISPYFADETLLPMPFANVPPFGYTDSAGLYTYSSGSVSSTLNGRYVRITDSCGAISLSGDVGGSVSFGTAAGGDCATAGFGGAGNTHAARTQYYWVNRAKEAGRTWLPGNTWLNNAEGTPLVVNVNIPSTCNAGWNGTALNFFRSGGGCGNTGEIAAVALHEYGHGLDQNDSPSGASPDRGTRETYGDFTAALTLRTSCIGDGFRPVKCDGYGDACLSCTGVRDIDWGKHAAMTPHTVANFTQTNCPINPFYTGPCGREGHCESYVSSEALWDFAARDLPSPGSSAAWAVAERLWYLSRPTATRAFTCNTAISPWSSDGCSPGSLWKTFRAADDDNGNLDDGTPHSGALFAAFNRHGIACASDPGAMITSSTCTPPISPTLTVALVADHADLSWTGSGTGMVYDIYRSDSGCSGFIKIANDLSGTFYSDSAIAPGLTYSYQVVAHPIGKESCASAPSTCQSVSSSAPLDVWSKDTPADGGTIPAAGDMWKSEDIWVNNLTSGGSHEDPELGDTNYVHVKVRNAGPGTAHGVLVRMYWADANIGLSWPADWNPIGTASIPSLPATGLAEAEAVLPWSPPGIGHFCLLARIVTPQDPMITAETTDIDHNVRYNNNVVWKNVNVVDLLPFAAEPAGFTIANSGRSRGLFRLTFREVPKQGQAPLLDYAQLSFRLPEKLFRRWVAAGRPGKGVRLLPGHYLRITSPEAAVDLPLEPGEKFDPCLAFRLDGAAAGAPPTKFWFEIVMDRIGQEGDLIPIGGIAYDLRIGGDPVGALVSAAKEVRGTFAEGGLITYILTLRNRGAGIQPDNPGDELFDQLPPEIEPLSVKTTAGRALLDHGAVSWNGMIRPRQSVTVTVEGRLRPGTRGRTVANQAQVFYDADGNGTNESSTSSDDPSTPTAGDATQLLVQEPVLSIEGEL